MKKEKIGLNYVISWGLYYLKIVFFICVALLYFYASNGCRKEDNKIVLQREWTANAEYTGDIWASKISKDYGIELEVREGSEALDPVKQVRVGDVHFGVASSDRVLQENESGAELVILASATYKSPVVFLSRKDSGILEPKDFKDKTIGIQAGTNTELIFYALISKVGLTEKDMRIVESGWGIQTFVTGDIDVLAAFDYDETIQLDKKNIYYETIFPEEYGVKYVGTVYFTRKTLIQNKPELVQSFMNCLVKGWKNAINEPYKALDFLFEYANTLDKDKERKSFLKGIKYFKGEKEKLLFSSMERWNNMMKNLINQERLDKKFSIEKNLDYSFLENALIQLDINEN